MGAWSRMSVRGRLTLTVTVATAVALMALSWLMLAWLRGALVDEVQRRNDAALRENLDVVRRTPEDVAELVTLGSDRAPLPPSPRFGEDAATPSDTLVSVSLTPTPIPGMVVDSGADEEMTLRILGDVLPQEADPRDYVGSSGQVQSTQGMLRVDVATSLSDVNRSVAVVRMALWTVVPLFVVSVAMGSWAMTGRSLEPVEALRRRVGEITARTLDERVPVPPTDDEVAHLATTMNEMLDRLEASSRRERQFVSDAGHELRSPVAIIRAQVETALTYPDGADWEAVGATVLAQGERLDRLVSDLFTLARLEEGAFGPLPTTEVDLDELVLAQVQHLTDRRLDLSGLGAARVRGDGGQLASVVRNLVENAGRHAASTVRVSVAASDADATMVVEDDGPGIPADQRATVFERFGRLEEARSRDHGGAGLGLPLAARIVARHGGSLTLEDSELGGARFVVRLPLAEAESPETEPAEASAEARSGTVAPEPSAH
ncbi:MAG: HAMP domain-containing sensor histidine kinase [Microthrixaceae bacterium]